LKIIDRALKEFDLKEDSVWAVRSSGGLEDSFSTSFAGQNRTYLNVKLKELPKRVLDVSYSNESERVKEYSKRNNVNCDSINVLIQEMISSPQISGVIFTKNPITNNKNHFVIEVVEGIGEKLMSGKISPSSYIINKNNLEVIEFYEGDSKVNLSKNQIKELVKYGNTIDEMFGWNSDIEFCYNNNKINFLQVRPITT